MAEVTHEQVPANGIELHVAVAGPADGPPVVLVHGFPELWYSWRHQLGALGDAGYRALAARPARLRRELAPHRGGRLRLGPADRRPVRTARPLRLRDGRLRRPRLGRHGRVGAGPPPSRARLVPVQHERPLHQRPGAADGDLRGDLRRQVLLHALLPAGRAGRGGVRGGPAPVPAHHALRGRWRGHGQRQPARRRRARARAPASMDILTARARRAAGLADRARRRRLRRGLREGRLLRPGELLPQHGRQLGARQGHPGLRLHHAHRLHHRLARPGERHDARGDRGDGRGAARLPRRHGRRGRRPLGATGDARRRPTPPCWRSSRRRR